MKTTNVGFALLWMNSLLLAGCGLTDRSADSPDELE